MVRTEKYDFSFTASSLRLNQMILVAKSIAENKEIDFVNDLGGGKSSTGKRMLSELKKRIAYMTPTELELLLVGDLVTQKQLGFVMVCKSYGFIRDFVIEVLREKLLVFDYQITDGDYITFFRRKYDLHEEMESLTELTKKKIKQVTFKILEQGGLIDNIKSRIIQPQIVDVELMKSIAQDNSYWLKTLLVSDFDIERIKR
ncbi:MAG: DUF1819 family protein [Flavobacterium sp.]|nr:MAG: DUF1819 family protein [Flavobacterium sp.]